MMPFIAGLAIGAALGVTVMALCAAAGGPPTAPRVVVADPETDGATGRCACGSCGGPIDPCDQWCRHCGARMGDA